MDKYATKAKKIVEDNIYMTIATSSSDGNPWISPVFFVYDSNYNLYWVSNKDSKHSENVRKNSRVAIVIFDSRATEGRGDGVYFETSAEELIDVEQIKEVMNLWNKRATEDEFKIKSIEDVTNQGVWRAYKASPSKISTLTEGELINGQYVDKRIEIKFE